MTSSCASGLCAYEVQQTYNARFVKEMHRLVFHYFPNSQPIDGGSTQAHYEFCNNTNGTFIFTGKINWLGIGIIRLERNKLASQCCLRIENAEYV
jgi:hypothetical protein